MKRAQLTTRLMNSTLIHPLSSLKLKAEKAKKYSYPPQKRRSKKFLPKKTQMMPRLMLKLKIRLKPRTHNVQKRKKSRSMFVNL